MSLPVGLTDEQLKILFEFSRPLNQQERGRFMELVGERLRGFDGEVGVGSLTRIAVAAQKQVFRPPLGSEDAAPLFELEG
jgi:hypothetical protein